MSERDEYGPGQRPESAAQPAAEWREDTTLGLQQTGGNAWSGAGASVAGGSSDATRTTDTTRIPDTARSADTTRIPDTAAGTGGSVRTGAHGHPEQSESYDTTPQYSTSPVTVRRPDAAAALLLVLAGIAAAISLLLNWISDFDRTGWKFVQDGFEDFTSSTWPPPVVVLAGGALLVLGLLMFVPARGHRTLGVLALLVSIAAITAVVILLNSGEWSSGSFDIGFWFAAAVAVLGLLGALKAMLTSPGRGDQARPR